MATNIRIAREIAAAEAERLESEKDAAQEALAAAARGVREARDLRAALAEVDRLALASAEARGALHAARLIQLAIERAVRSEAE